MNGGQPNMPSGVADTRHNMAASSGPHISTSWLKDVSTNPILARETGVFRPGTAPGPGAMVDLRSYPPFLGANPSLLVNSMVSGLTPIPSATTVPSSIEPRIQSTTNTVHTHSDRQTSRHSTPSHSPVPGMSYRTAPRPAEPANQTAPPKRPKLDGNMAPVVKSEVSSVPHRPDYFHKGSIIQLADTNMKRIEDLQTSDFENSAYLSPNLALDCSSVVEIKEDPSRGTALVTFAVGDPNRAAAIKATVEATLEHPFFVYSHGWCSISPSHTMRFYQLVCQKLRVGDRCVSLTYNEKPAPPPQYARHPGPARLVDKN